MAVRTACFVGFLVLPGYWKLASLLAAGILAMIAVLLANNSDHREPATVEPDDQTRPALPAGPVIPGTVEEDE